MDGREGSPKSASIDGPDQQYSSRGMVGVNLQQIPRCSKMHMKEYVRNITFVRSVHDVEIGY